MTGGKNNVVVVPQPKIRNKDAVDEDLVGGVYPADSESTHEIMLMLKKLVDGNQAVRERINSMDDQVRRTQMDLEHLVSRSSNNNKHLQSLLISSQDIKDLHRSLQQMSIQQQEQLDQNKDVETVMTQLIGQQTADLKSWREVEKIKLLEDKLAAYETKCAKLEELDDQIVQKERRLAEVDTLLRQRQEKFDELRRKADLMQKSLQDEVLERYRNVHDTIAVSMANISSSSERSGDRTSRVASLLRNKYMNDKFKDNRRVVSLNEPRPSSTFDHAPQNNSDFDDSA